MGWTKGCEGTAFVVGLLGCISCSGDEAVTPTELDCGELLQVWQGRCVPHFDDCGDGEISLLGGGCKRVGVKACPGGLAGPPDWKCKPIGPPTECLPGWAIKDDDGWCEPILPPMMCSGATMEVIGEAECQPVGDCGSGKYPEVKEATAQTLFVDQAYAGGDSDGSEARPFSTIVDAVAAASAGAMLAIAEGRYVGDLVIDQPLVLAGRCAEKVIIEGAGVASHAVVVAGAGDLRISGVTMTGPRGGIVVRSAKAEIAKAEIAKAVIDRVIVADCGGSGIESHGSPQVLITESLIDSATGGGIVAFDTALSVERCAIRDTQHEPGYRRGMGIEVQRLGAGLAKLQLRDSVVLGNRTRGIMLWDADASIERSIVASTRENEGWKGAGEGVLVLSEQHLPKLKLRDSIVANNRDAGLSLIGAEVTLQRVVIRDTRPRESDDDAGVGIYLWGEEGLAGARLDIADSLLTGNHSAALMYWDAAVSLQRTVVRDTQPRAGNKLDGGGVVGGSARGISSLQLDDCLVDNNYYVGINTAGGRLTIQRTLIRDTQAQVADNRGGMGLFVSNVWGQTPTVTLRDSALTNNSSVGAILMGALTTIERSIVADTQPQADTGANGVGLLATLLQWGESRLLMRDSLVDNNRTVGVGVGLSTAMIQGSTIRRTLTEEATGSYGDGIASSLEHIDVTTNKLAAMDGKDECTLTVIDSLVDGSGRVGLGYWGSDGVVRRSAFRDGVFSINLEQSAEPSIASDNLFEGNTENTVTFGQSIEPAPPPSFPRVPTL